MSTNTRIVWKRIGEAHYEAEVGGKRYHLKKSALGLYFMHVFSPEAAENNRRAREDLSLRLQSQWKIVKPHPHLFDFGSTLAKAKANARLWLVEGRGGDDPAWQD